MSIGFITHPDCALHETGAAHPESPARLQAINDQLIASGLELVLQHYESPVASLEQLCRVHDRDYVNEIFRKAPDDGLVRLDDDTPMGPHSLSAALHAAGAVVMGVDLVMTGKNRQVFCSVRPPGHHAERHRAMGFCIFNNIAIGAAHALKQYSIERLAIIDFDVHHGNGTEDIFHDNPSVLFCSTFQHPFYPFTGIETSSHNVINVPLPPGTGGAEFRKAIEDNWLERIDNFQPELFLISAGFDGHLEDEMAGFALVDTDYAWVTGQIKKLADRHAEGRIVSSLEGGYALSALGRSVVAHLNALL